MKKMMTVTNVETTPGCVDWPPASLKRFIAWVNAELESIPVEARETATIDFDVVERGRNERAEPLITIQYEELESDEEYERRLINDQRELGRSVHAEQFRLIRLMNKYPDVAVRYLPKEISPGHFRPTRNILLD